MTLISTRRARVARLLVAGVVALVTAACGGGSSGGQQARPEPSTPALHGAIPSDHALKPSFQLATTSGKPFDFRADTNGKVTLAYFGYTHCPDECPTAMADIAAALRKVQPGLRKKVRVVFVTTDAKRDTGAVVRQWLDQWSSSYVGLVGTQAELDAAARASGVQPGEVGPDPSTIPGHPDEHVEKPGTAPHKHFGPLGYSVAHSAVIYAYDASDRLPVVYPGGVTPADIAADLPVLART